MKKFVDWAFDKISEKSIIIFLWPWHFGSKAARLLLSRNYSHAERRGTAAICSNPNQRSPIKSKIPCWKSHLIRYTISQKVQSKIPVHSTLLMDEDVILSKICILSYSGFWIVTVQNKFSTKIREFCTVLYFIHAKFMLPFVPRFQPFGIPYEVL